MNQPPAPTPAGWYPDPYRQAARRYWDGTQWTGHVDAPAAAPSAPQPQPGTNGWAIASLVLGVIGWALLAIPFGLVARRQIRRAGGRQTGLGVATAGIVLGCAWLVFIAVVVALAATGSFGTTNAERFGGARQPIARVVDNLQSGLDDNNGWQVCNELFTERWEALVARGSGRSCVGFVNHVDAGKHQADLDVKSIAISGNVATAHVDEGDTHETVRFVRVSGRWRVDEIRR